MNQLIGGSVRSAVFAVPVTIVLAVTMGACGSTKTQVSAPTSTTTPAAPAKLALDAAGGADAAIAPQGVAHYVLDGSLADLGAEGPVRKLLAHDVSDADLARIAGALGLHGTPQRTDTGSVLHDGDATLTVDTSGAVTFVGYSASGGSVSGGAVGGGASSPPSAGRHGPPIPEPMPVIPPPIDVPSADAAATIAQSLLDQLGVRNGQDWSHEVAAADAAVSACPTDAYCPPVSPVVYARTVSYQLLLNGAPVPGVMWSVTVGEHRRVTSLSGSWASVQAPTNYRLRSTAAVFDDLKHGRAQFAGPQPLLAVGMPIKADAPPVHITGVSLGAARRDGTDHGSPVAYLVPTYRFHAQVPGGAPYDIEVIALDPASFTIVPSVGQEVGK
jgi:hypothetical protein